MRHLLTLADLSSEEIGGLLALAEKLKRQHRRGGNRPLLAGQVLAMLFQKPSLRTRVSFEVGMEHLGGHGLYLAPAEVGLGVRESAADVARVLSRYAQGIMARVFKHSDLEIMAAHASVPIINGLSDYDHPCQVMADLLTLREHLGIDFRRQQLVFIGDGYNMANGLLFGASKIGLNIVVATPDAYKPSSEVMARTMEYAEESGARVRWTTDPHEALHEADVVYTDVWTSMGQEAENEVRRRAFRDYQLNAALMKSAPTRVLIMHCLPAHRGEEITDEVADAPNSIVFDQAENRLHAQKAILAWLMGGVKLPGVPQSRVTGSA
ncbi:MAG: ornithine carbamoyltransferase [Chloroflexi bacterium]|nr:ornithine carbamoyltransferase [Chloroflexota bacterium]